MNRFINLLKECFHPDSTYKCLAEGGKCIYEHDKDTECNRGIIKNQENEEYCPETKYCCLDCQTPECKLEDEDWLQQDGECALVGGECQFDSLDCPHFGSEACGGPTERRCCLTSPPPTSSTDTPVPTVPDVPTTDPPTGISSGAIVGIVFGSVIVLTVTIGMAFYYGKHKSSGKRYCRNVLY